MASGAEGIRAGRAYVEIGTDQSPLEKGLNAAKQRLGAFAGALGALGSALALGFVTNKITGWVEAFAESGREIYLMARAAGISTAEISELKGAVQILGGDLGETVGGMRKMGIFLHEVAGGSREANSAMQQLGLTVADVAGMSEIDKLQLIGERLAAIGDLNTRQAIGRQVFGRGGGALVGLAGGLGAARAEAGASGLSPERVQAQVKSAFDLSQALKMLGKTREQVGKSIGAALAPAFTLAAKTIAGIVKQVRNWVDANEEVVQKVALIGSAIVGVSATLLAVAAGVKLFGFVAAGVAAVFSGILAVITSIAGIVTFAFSPIGLAVVTAGALLFYLGEMSGAFAAIARAGARVGEVFNRTFEGIKNAISAGDIETAFEIALTGLKVLLSEFNDWAGLTFGITFTDMFAEMKIGWAKALASMRTAWVEFQEFINPHIRDLARSRFGPSLFGPWLGHAQNIVAATAAQQGPVNAQIAAINAERDAAIALARAARPGSNLTQELSDQLETLNRDAFYRAYSAQAARDMELPGDVADQLGQGSTRSTFNRDVLFGRSGSPVERLIEKTDTMIERLNLLIPIRAELQRLGPAEVG